MCELGCMIVAFLVPLDGIFAAKACSLNHSNEADPSQGFDSSETTLYPPAPQRSLQHKEKRGDCTGQTHPKRSAVCKRLVLFYLILVQ